MAQTKDVERAAESLSQKVRILVINVGRKALSPGLGKKSMSRFRR